MSYKQKFMIFFIQSIEERDALGQMKIITGVLAVDGRRLVDASPLIDLQRWPAMQLSPSWTQAKHCRVVMTYCSHPQNMSIRKAKTYNQYTDFRFDPRLTSVTAY